MLRGRRRPRPGVVGAETCAEVGNARPRDPGDLQFLVLSNWTPAAAEFTGPDARKKGHYMSRWITTRGEAGRWSVTASETIGP